jgi:hypothetical protein
VIGTAGFDADTTGKLLFFNDRNFFFPASQLEWRPVALLDRFLCK